ERPRWSDLTEQPLCAGEVGPRGRPGIRADAEPGVTIPLGIANAQRLNEIRLRLDEITLQEARVTQEATGKPTLRRSRSAFSLAQKCLSNLPRQPQLAAHRVAAPQTVINGESLGRVIDRRGKFPGADEGGLRFLGAETPGKHKRLAKV